jgi:hypothetical protein
LVETKNPGLVRANAFKKVGSASFQGPRLEAKQEKGRGKLRRVFIKRKI